MGIPLFVVAKTREKLNGHELIELGRNYKKIWLQLIRDSLKSHLPSSDYSIFSSCFNNKHKQDFQC